LISRSARGDEDMPQNGRWQRVNIVCAEPPTGRRKDAMRQPSVDDVVRLTQDIPELSLNRGVTGVVRSTWFAPWIAYEVEFEVPGHSHHTRALLMAEQVEVAADELETVPA
jgi:hypothetical protein